MPVALVAIVPDKLLNQPAIRKSLNAEMKKQLDIVDRMYGRITRTWTHKPKFTRSVTNTRSEIKQSTTTDDPPMLFLDEGTRIRWAVMSGNFSPKTKHRTIGSGGGAGGAVIIGRRAMQARNIAPRPGIKARKFTDEIVKRRQGPYARAMSKALAAGVKRGRPFRS